MASVSGGGSSGGRKSLDAEINLVPFIDLLSMCICFLLMTAVWTQLASVQVKQANGTDGAAVEKKSLDLGVKFVSATALELNIKAMSKSLRTLQVQGATTQEMLASLNSQLPAIKASLKGQGEIGAVMLTPGAGVDYGTMVSIMDVLRKNQLVNLGVVPVQAATKAGG